MISRPRIARIAARDHQPMILDRLPDDSREALQREAIVVAGKADPGVDDAQAGLLHDAEKTLAHEAIGHLEQVALETARIEELRARGDQRLFGTSLRIESVPLRCNFSCTIAREIDPMTLLEPARVLGALPF